MAFDFQETFKVTIPDVEQQLTHFSESEYKNKHGLIIEIAAIHSGITANYNEYTTEALTAAVETWLKPYNKPIIMNHDKLTEPIGRVIGAAMAKEDDGTPYIKLQAAITDPQAVQKVLDRRYLTGSVGGKTDEAVCSVCNTDWAVVKESNRAPCAHRRGRSYKGQIATLKMAQIDFKEYSIVNMPSDSLSSIRGIQESTIDIDEGWNNKTRFFVLDMDEEEIVEFVESDDQGRDILADMKKREAAPLYREMKGAFIEAQILSEEDGVKGRINDTKDIDGIETDSEETKMANEDTEVVENEAHEDDILAVTEGLSADLAAAEADTNTGDESDSEEAERAEGQEKSHNSDVDAETSKGAPKSREGEEADATSLDEATEDADDTELKTQIAALEQSVEELTAKVSTLEETNTKLRTVMKRSLAERVVDAKIEAGMIESADRATEIEEHDTRTASSLADSLRDLRKAPKSKTLIEGLESEMKDETVVVEGDEPNTQTVDVEEQHEDAEETTDADAIREAEDIFVSALMGRRLL